MKPKLRLVSKRLKKNQCIFEGVTSQIWQDCKHSKKRKEATTAGSMANQPND